MNASSILLTPSAPQRSDGTGSSYLASSPLLVDVVPFEPSLQRLLHAKVSTEEQLCSYSLQQAYRGLLYGVRAARLTLTGVETVSTHHGLAVASINGGAMHSATTDKAVATMEACVLRGWQAALYRMSLAATRSAADMKCVIFLSTQILCNPATAYGEGNERPCCKDQWTQALLHGLPLRDDMRNSADQNELDERFSRLVQANRRYQIGFLILLSNTLRMVANGSVESQRLCAEHAELFTGIARVLVPKVAQCVEESLREGVMHAAKKADAVGAAPIPSRLAVEFNNLVIHCGLWLTTDVLMAHTDANVDAAVDGKGEVAVKTRKQRRRPLVLDGDQPACLWGCVTVVRNALRRGLNWLAMEFDKGGSRRAPSPATALLLAVSQQLEQVFADVIKQEELLQNALLNATREFNSETSLNVRNLKEMTWVQTLQMCFLVRSLTSVWVAVHGGLGLSTTSTHLVLQTNRDVLMLMASTLLRLPASEDSKESERTNFMATDAALGACLALVAAAPTAKQQAQLWSTDSTVTQQIHSLLVQRAFRYRNARVLRLASLLSRAVLDASVCDGALAGFAADSSDQLLELLENEDDAASRCVGELLCVSILEQPYRLIPALFRMLQHGSACTRRHVLELLSNLPDLVSEQHTAERRASEECLTDSSAPDTVAVWTAGGGKSADARRRNVLRLLAENLFLQLQDEELCVRLLSSSLFAKVHPEDVLLPLMNLCVQRDSAGRKQSAALSALTSVLTAHTDTVDTYLLLLQCGYQCHLAVMGDTSMGAEIPLGTQKNVENGGNKEIPTAVCRPTPQTPGDILSQALLYSPDSAGVEAPNPSSAPASMSVTAGELDGSSSDAHAGSHRRKEAQLQSALLTITDCWVRSAAPCWTYAGHSFPLFQFLAREAYCGVRHSTAHGIGDSGAPDEERVQWAMRYTLRLTATLTGALDGCVSPADNALIRALHLRALWDTFFARPPDTEGPPHDLWTRTIYSAGGEDSGNAGASSTLHAVLLPLLCLRSCASSMFAAAPLTVLEQEVEPSEKNDDSDEDNISNVLRRLWQVLWHGVTNGTDSSAAFFAAYPDIQRVLLEVLCRFPPRLFFQAWTRWIKTQDACAPTAMTSLDHRMTAQRLFSYRVYLFGISSYLSAASVMMTSRQSDPPASAAAPVTGEHRHGSITDFRVVLEYRATLEHLLSVALPQWLMAEEECVSLTLPAGQQSDVTEATSAANPVRASGQCSNRQAVSMRQRLCAAAVDAGAVIGVVGLTPLESLPAFSGSPTSGDGDASVLYALCDSLLERPLIELAKAYREHESARLKERPIQDDVASEAQWTLQLTRFQVCVRIHECMLRAISYHPVDSKGLLLSWFRRFLRSLVELSNAACRSEAGRGPHNCRVAVDACSLIFHAVLLTHKLGNAPICASSNATGDTSSAPSPLLLRLAWEEREAIVSFAVGCVRFMASAAVQTAGVRLLSGLLVAAPELFVTAEESGTQATTSMFPLSPSASASCRSSFSDAHCPLSFAASALRGIALMHADRPTRLLAEEVLQMLEKAAAATAG
ncbi:hypothetical protein JKF63_01784 [Porcisia hertigi]|uniref:Uncharacterized protein n=1 Tax=Porcisia hertigi TaxID=2761500 RepID=A0A836HWU4_9TRYP|nr:hypothetical protein JKF63_01784 [Porcisia hertigi]